MRQRSPGCGARGAQPGQGGVRYRGVCKRVAHQHTEGTGVGEIDALSAAYLGFTPPNPNENFAPFIQQDSATGGYTFDEAGWSSHVGSVAGWSSANWASANWASAGWSSANWASASWSSANWSSDVNSMMSTSVNWSESVFTP